MLSTFILNIPGGRPLSGHNEFYFFSFYRAMLYAERVYCYAIRLSS